MTKPFLSLSAQEIRSAAPKGCALLKTWLFDMNLKTAPEGVDPAEYRVQLEQAVTDDLVDNVLEYSPRLLYDFFDSHEVRLAIDCGDTRWTFDINGRYRDGDPYDLPSYDSRWKAEEAAFREAFEYLEHVTEA